MSKKVGILAQKYCKLEENDSVRYDCSFAIQQMTDAELAELGFSRRWSKHDPKSDIPDDQYDKCERSWFHLNNTVCKNDEFGIYHGTSQEAAERIKNTGFKAAPAFYGTGVYFQRAYNKFGQPMYIRHNTAMKYARDNEYGTIIAGCFPEKEAKGYHDMYTLDDKGEYHTPPWYKEFQRAKNESPERIELFFAWHGKKYDTIAGLRRGFTAVGNKVRDIALRNGMRAYKDDGGQVVVYDPNLLRRIPFYELKACRTFPQQN